MCKMNVNLIHLFFCEKYVYKEKYPLVQIVLHTATADTVYESKWNNKKSGRDDCWLPEIHAGLFAK